MCVFFRGSPTFFGGWSELSHFLQLKKLLSQSFEPNVSGDLALFPGAYFIGTSNKGILVYKS